MLFNTYSVNYTILETIIHAKFRIWNCKFRSKITGERTQINKLSGAEPMTHDVSEQMFYLFFCLFFEYHTARVPVAVQPARPAAPFPCYIEKGRDRVTWSFQTGQALVKLFLRPFPTCRFSPRNREKLS